VLAKQYDISRAQQDEFAVASQNKAEAAQKAGKFKDEIVPVMIPQKKGDPKCFCVDERPRSDASMESLGKLRPAFEKEGTVTAGNASSINDGAAALVLATADLAAKRSWVPLARIVGSAGHAQAPEWFTTAPAGAIDKLLARVGWKKEDVDLWEINEAFAVVSIANNRMLGLDPARVNVWGGAVAMGHPIGASGARILTTLLYALEDLNLKRGIASLRAGGGRGMEMAIEHTGQGGIDLNERDWIEN
jgi:acetyl-CoA C-acetyltransferase